MKKKKGFFSFPLFSWVAKTYVVGAAWLLHRLIEAVFVGEKHCSRKNLIDGNNKITDI